MGYPTLYILVSILVLMEVSFRLHSEAFLMERGILGFNPCFNGSIFQTREINLGNRRRPGVSILVLMEVSFRL